MPAAAVIPAPIVYIKVVAVKKLVVECRNNNADLTPRRQILAMLFSFYRPLVGFLLNRPGVSIFFLL